MENLYDKKYMKLEEESSRSQINSDNEKDSEIKLKIRKEKYINIDNTSSSDNKDEILQTDSTPEDVISIRNIHKTYLIGIEGVSALRGVSLSVSKGEFLVILGTSGGGKTTLLNIIGTIDTPSRGDIKIFDTVIRSKTGDEVLSSIRVDQVAFVFQSFNLLPNLNVIENVEIPMKIKGDLTSEEIRDRAKELLDKVGLSNRLTHFPNQLSGGEQQRVTIARALSNKPKILLLDEPTGDLDTKNSDIVMNILLDLNMDEQITMIMVTHDVGLKSYANRVVRVVDGKINSTYLIDRSVRQESIRLLKDRVANKSHALREGANSNAEDFDCNASNPHISTSKSNTFVRKVSDYKIKKINNY